MIWCAYIYFGSAIRPFSAQYGATFGQPSWAFQERHNPPEIRFDNLPNEDPLSASSVSTHGSIEPWSPVAGHRFAGLPGTQDAPFAPATDEPYMNSYPASISVMSLESSSPQPQGLNTPSSTRSPSFAAVNLHSTSPQTTNVGSFGLPAFSPDQEQTPRLSQNNFNQVSYQLMGAGLRQSSQQVSKRKRGDQVQREPTHSPFSSGSEYVMVESSSKTALNAKRMSSKMSKTQQSDVFFHEHFPPTEEKRPKRSTEYAVRKSSNGRKSGGRSLGMHLAPEKATKAKDLRIDGACWICCLQRDSVRLEA
jgi:hypothetical protein